MQGYEIDIFKYLGFPRLLDGKKYISKKKAKMELKEERFCIT